jgi:hypothetical protein
MEPNLVNLGQRLIGRTIAEHQIPRTRGVKTCLVRTDRNLYLLCLKEPILLLLLRTETWHIKEAEMDLGPGFLFNEAVRRTMKNLVRIEAVYFNVTRIRGQH